MITTLTGKRRNVGDYLISYRAHDLLRRFVDEDVVDLNRFHLPPDFYDIINRSRALFLCGGPAYRDRVYPNVYNLDLDRIHVPVIPYGLGWKAPAGVRPDDFSFTPQSQDFIKRIHAGIPGSSVRDALTLQVIQNLGIQNVTMTGCPSLYDLDCMDKIFLFKDDIDTLVLSGPAAVDGHVMAMTSYLARRFPRARKILALHHGYYPNLSREGVVRGIKYVQLAGMAKWYGYEIADLHADLPRMTDVYNRADLHVGYRVHGHLYCLSQRIPSFLISEDARGVGQAQTWGMASIFSGPDTVRQVEAALDDHFHTKASALNASLPAIKKTFGVMKDFLEDTKEFLEFKTRRSMT